MKDISAAKSGRREDCVPYGFCRNMLFESLRGQAWITRWTIFGAFALFIFGAFALFMPFALFQPFAFFLAFAFHIRYYY